MQSEVKGYDGKFDDLRNVFSDEIDIKINHHMKKNRQNAGGGATVMASNPADVLSGEGAANLKKMLFMKADKVDLERLFELKCNKIDIENILDI